MVCLQEFSPVDVLQEKGFNVPADDLGEIMGKDKMDLLQGTLDLLILKALKLGPMHGFGIAVLIRQMSEDVLRVEQGSLYPALYRLKRQGWIESEWGASENNRKAKFYKLTAAGRIQLVQETSNWEKLSRAINLIVRPAYPYSPP
jgi:PadR family transcriptional regulator, regulatory protein PadR